MTPSDAAPPPTVLDPRQLVRIEAVHRGFLYQHLYVANCLLRAGRAGVEAIVVEGDEDVELEKAGSRIYVQVKTRVETLAQKRGTEPCPCLSGRKYKHCHGR